MHLQKTTLLKGWIIHNFVTEFQEKAFAVNAQPQSEILRSKGFGGVALNKQFVAVDSHKHCLRQYASLKKRGTENYALTAFYHCDYVNVGLMFIPASDKMILTNGGVSLERSGRKIAALRESVKLSQVKWLRSSVSAKSSSNRYSEPDQASPTFETRPICGLLWDVFMDYIFGRTDKSSGQAEEYKPKIQQNDPQMQ